MRAFIIISLILFVSSTNTIYYSSCSESATRTCSYGTNVTDRLLALKKGGTDVLSTNNYDPTHFVCENYDYDCGYAVDIYKFITIANGVQLNLTYAELLNIVPSDATLTNKIKPYLLAQANTLQCVGGSFPLTLTATQSTTVLTGFLNRLVANLTAVYATGKASYALAWADININIKTAVLQTAKYYMNINFIASNFWTNFQYNNWALMSSELKDTYKASDCLQCLRSAYLIDSVTVRCNKYQSVNFLVDQSGSIGSTNFQYALKFLTTYVNRTNDDLSIMSIHFYDSTYEPYIYYGNNRATILGMIASKPYRSRGTYTGLAINASVARIGAANYPNGVPKILVILTDGGSYDNVYYASQYARSQGITLFCVGIGGGINKAQLLQIAGTQSNVLYIANYGTLDKLAEIIENYFCKQIVDVHLYDNIIGNVVRVPTSPNYYRVQRDSSSIYYRLIITYKVDPSTTDQQVRESHFDPFPDYFSEYAKTENYRTSIVRREYFISPQSPEVIPIKQKLTVTQTPTHAYISVAGTSMNFNVTLQPCNTTNCTVERQTAAIQNSEITGIPLNQNTSSSAPATVGKGEYGPNVSVFVGIGVGLAATGLCTLLMIGGMRKFKEAPEQEPLKSPPESQHFQQSMNNQIQNPPEQEALPQQVPAQQAPPQM